MVWQVTYTDKQQRKSSEGACHFPVLTLVLCRTHLLNQKRMRAVGWSAELPAAPSQSQLLTLFHHRFASLLFHWFYSADGARKRPAGAASRLQRNPLGWFPLQPTSRERVWTPEATPSPSLSHLQPLWRWEIFRGAGRLYSLHSTQCISMTKLPSFLNRYNILILLHVLIPPSPKSSVMHWARFDQHYLLF